MIRRFLRRAGRDRPGDEPEPLPASPIPPDLPIPYSWVLTNRLAVGPMPASAAHWQQLEEAGLRSRFSCCYTHEEGALPVPPPAHWLSDQQALPDHRRQERLDADRLAAVLDRAQQQLHLAPPLYLHCLAGMERSPLIAVGLTARERQLSLFEALEWVRRCHPAALPIYAHLDLLDQVLARSTPALGTLRPPRPSEAVADPSGAAQVQPPARSALSPVDPLAGERESA